MSDERKVYTIDPRAARSDVDYSIDHTVMAKRLALLGLKDTEIAGIFGVSLNRFMGWQGDHPELSSALMMGRDMADAHVAEGMYKRAAGYEAPAVKFFKMKTADGEEIVSQNYMEHIPPDPNAGKFWLTARRPDLWKEQSHQAVSGNIEISGSGLSGLLAMAKAHQSDD
jgi:hypothetical protein